MSVCGSQRDLFRQMHPILYYTFALKQKYTKIQDGNHTLKIEI